MIHALIITALILSPVAQARASVDAFDMDALETQALLSKDEPIERVASPSIKIVGRGIEDRKHGHSIALACVGEPESGRTDPSCRKIRHVIFKAHSSEAYFYGETYLVVKDGEALTKKAVKNTLKGINRDYKQLKIDRYDGNSRFKKIALSLMCVWFCTYFFVLYTGIGTVEGAVTTGLAITPGVGWFIVGASVLWVPFMILMGSNRVFNPQAGKIVKALENKNGWNWEVKPKKVSNKIFKIYIEASTGATPENDIRHTVFGWNLVPRNY